MQTGWREGEEGPLQARLAPSSEAKTGKVHQASPRSRGVLMAPGTPSCLCPCGTALCALANWRDVGHTLWSTAEIKHSTVRVKEELGDLAEVRPRM